MHRHTIFALALIPALSSAISPAESCKQREASGECGERSDCDI